MGSFLNKEYYWQSFFREIGDFCESQKSCKDCPLCAITGDKQRDCVCYFHYYSPNEWAYEAVKNCLETLGNKVVY